MLKYTGRQKELNLLENSYNSSKFEFGFLYGQWRIGKTTLMEMIKENKKSIMFFATDSDDVEIRRSFTNSLNNITGNKSVDNYNDWFSFFQAIDSYFQNEKGLVVIDEFPNIVLTRDGKRKKTDFTSSLQRAIDTMFNYKLR